MSKTDSGHYSGTHGCSEKLIAEVILRGDKISPKKVLFITRTEDEKIVWLESGDTKSGLEHIISRHAAEFDGINIHRDEIPVFIRTAIEKGTIIGYQGKKNPRPVFEFGYGDMKYRIAIQISENGYIVSANMKNKGEK